MVNKYIHIDLFSGIGGFSLGLKQAGFPISKTYFSEIDKYAISVYRRNFIDAEYIGGVESISGSRFKRRKTIITFGFPCQDLSIAGKRRGFDGSRSSLFFEAMRIIEEVKPDIFIFENVKGFYSSNDGKDFQIALQTIADIGLYECEWQLLNTAWFLPQNRERIYFIGHLAGKGGSKVFPIRENGGVCDKSRKVEEKIYSNNKAITQMARQYTNWCGDFVQVKALTECRSEEAKQIRKKNLKAGKDFSPRRGKDITIRKDNNSNTVTATQSIEQAIISRPHGFNKGGEKKLPCLRASSFEHNEFLKDGASIRRLTPIECERLQGFKDDWTKYGHEGQIISDSQRYKMCGNAVSVPVVKAIGEKLF